MTKRSRQSGPPDSRMGGDALIRAMFRSCTRIAVVACDRSFRLLYCNAAAESLFGKPAAPDTGDRLVDLLAGGHDEAERIAAVCETSIQRGYAEVSIRPAAERSVSLQLTIMPLRDDTDDHIGYLVFGMDNTARRRTEEMLLHYQRAVEASGNLVSAIDRTGTFVLANQAFLASLGLSRGEVIGRKAGQVFEHRATFLEIADSIERSMDGEELTFEKKRPGPDGGIRTFLDIYYPLRGSNADIRGVVMVSEDISALKEAEHRVQEALTEKERLIDSLTAALDEVKTLRGFIPICAHCKKVRDDKGYWSQVEEYISAHSDAEFSHGICPECMERYFPEMQASDTGDEAPVDD